MTFYCDFETKASIKILFERTTVAPDGSRWLMRYGIGIVSVGGRGSGGLVAGWVQWAVDLCLLAGSGYRV